MKSTDGNPGQCTVRKRSGCGGSGGSAVRQTPSEASTPADGVSAGEQLSVRPERPTAASHGPNRCERTRAVRMQGREGSLQLD